LYYSFKNVASHDVPYKQKVSLLINQAKKGADKNPPRGNEINSLRVANTLFAI